MFDLCIYHANCADGFTAAWAIRRAWPDMVFLPHAYGEALPDVKGKHVLIVDYSFKFPVLMNELGQGAGKAKSITVLDHHKSAEADLKTFAVKFTGDLLVPEALVEQSKKYGKVPIQAFFDMDQSGAMLAWKYAHGVSTPAPKLVEHVQDRDLWRFALDGTREISAAIFSHDYSFDTWDNIAEALETDEGWGEMVSEGEALERKHFKDIKELLAQTQRTMKIGGIEVPCANMPYMFASDAANIMSQGQPFAACYFDKNDGKRSFSLRASEGGADVSQIAVSYGGGGHAKAAGFAMPLGWEGDE